MTEVIIITRPLAPVTPSGRLGAYGLHNASALRVATGEQIELGAINEGAARFQARRRAQQAWGTDLTFRDAQEWQEVWDTLTATELEAAAIEAGDVDPRE